ncbi:MAG: glycosyltransferase [Candidatus Paceibacterota bacterium]
MKIIFLTSGSIRSNFTYRALALAGELQKQGHECAIVSPRADKYNNFTPEKIREEAGVRILQPWQLNTRRLEVNLLPYIFGAIWTVLKEKPDMVYIYKPTPISVVGLFAKFIRKTPVVLDMDDLGSEVMKIEGHPRYQQKLVEWCEKLSAKYCDRIVVASSFLYDMYSKQFPEKSIHLMPNGVSSDWFFPVRASEKKNGIVFMGSLNRRNILEPLFDVFPNVLKECPDVNLLIIGDGHYLSYFKEKSKKLGIEKKVCFAGWLNLSEAREKLRAGDIGYGFMPDDITTRAASNMKISQYMIRGVVPLVSRTGDLPAMVDFGKAGYICRSETEEDIQAEILHALRDNERKTSRAENARAFAMQHFSWEKLARDFDDWIKPKKNIFQTRKQKIYIVATNVPSNIGGPEIRNLNLLRQLRLKNDVDVSLFCITDKNSEKDLNRLKSESGISVYAFYKTSSSVLLSLRALIFNRIQPFMYEYRLSGMGDGFRAICEKELPDIVQIEQIEAYYCLLPYLAWLRKNGVKIIIDAHNVEINAFEGAMKSLSLPKRVVGKFLRKTLRNLEIEAAKNTDAIFACSEIDADYFRKYNKKVYLIPNGADCSEFFSQDQKDEQSLIFIGGVKYPPNTDALRFYLKKIHPKVKESNAKVQMLAIGATKNWLKKNHIDDSSVIPLGFVDDVRPYLQKAIIGICPIRQGSGTRLKVLTFMASGLPVVTTSKGIEGIGCSNGENILIADSAEQFAKYVADLLNSSERRKYIGNNARKLMLENYDWNIIGERLRQYIKEI